MLKKSRAKRRPVRVGLLSLGCAKNLVDAEIMLGSLAKSGVEITSDVANADVVIVNTCSFIDSAQEESIDTILESAALREAQNRGQGLIVSGCLPQRFREELPKLLPEVDAFMGIDQVARVSEIVAEAIAHRKQRVESSKSKVQSSKSKRRTLSQTPRIGRKEKIVSKLAEEQIADEHQPTSGTSVNYARSAHMHEPLAAGHTAAHSETPLVHVHSRPTYIPDYTTPRFRLTPKHFAYVKIAEGCNHPCSFCTIPRMRGSHRSRPQADVLREARALIAQGVKELNLISQDSTYYGLDLRAGRNGSIAAPEKFAAAANALPANATTLCTLLRELNALPGEFWIRLLYTHPAHWTDELIHTIAECRKVARYVDIPLQHIHDAMLERMRRETSREYIVGLLRRIRAGIPGIALRTTFIVGFPGETEAYFEELLRFIRETKFERLGVFTYSQEEGTRAARMTAHVPDGLKHRRRARAMTEQLRVAREVAAPYVGRTLRVLIEKQAGAKDLQTANVASWEHGLMRAGTKRKESLHGNYLVARGEADAPDIDGRVYVRGDLPLSEFAQVKVIGHTDYDLIAERVK